MLKAVDNSKGSSWVTGFLSSFKNKLIKKADYDFVSNKNKITKLSWKDAEKVGLAKDINHIGHGIYQDKNGDIDMNSVWYLDKDAETGVSYLVKNVGENDKIIAKVMNKIKKAEKEKEFLYEDEEDEIDKKYSKDKNAFNLKDYRLNKKADLENDVVIFDNGGKTQDRYTIVFPDGTVVGSSDNPFHPQGFWQHDSQVIKKEKIDDYIKEMRENPDWLGGEISFDKLPEDVKKAIKDELTDEDITAKLNKKADLTIDNLLDRGYEIIEDEDDKEEIYSRLGVDPEKRYKYLLVKDDELFGYEGKYGLITYHVPTKLATKDYDEGDEPDPDETKTLAQHAEEWWVEQGNVVPERDTPEYENMYKKWHEYAFENFASNKSKLINKKAEGELDITYAVEVRNMHTAIHELFEYETEQEAEEAANIIKQIENFETEEDIEILWAQLLAPIDIVEINYRFVEEDSKHGRHFKNTEDHIIEIVNSNFFDIYASNNNKLINKKAEDDTTQDVTYNTLDEANQIKEQRESSEGKQLSVEQKEDDPTKFVIKEKMANINTKGDLLEDDNPLTDYNPEFDKTTNRIIVNIMREWKAFQESEDKDEYENDYGEIAESHFNKIVELFGILGLDISYINEFLFKENPLEVREYIENIINENLKTAKKRNLMQLSKKDKPNRINKKAEEEYKDYFNLDKQEDVDIKKKEVLKNNIENIEKSIKNNIPLEVLDIDGYRIVKDIKEKQDLLKEHTDELTFFDVNEIQGKQSDKFRINKKAGEEKYKVTILISSQFPEEIERAKEVLSQSDLESYGVDINKASNMTATTERGTTLSWELGNVSKDMVNEITEKLSDADQKLGQSVGIQLGAEVMTEKDIEKWKKEQGMVVEDENKEASLNKQSAEYRLYLDKFPSGKYGFVGSIPSEFLKEKINNFGQKELVSIIYNDKEEALEDIKEKGYSPIEWTDLKDSIEVVKANLNKQSKWQSTLRELYNSLEEWISYSETYGLAERLGYDNPEDAWADDPMIEGSTDPSDYKNISADYNKYKAEDKNDPDKKVVVETDETNPKKINKILDKNKNVKIDDEGNMQKAELNKKALDDKKSDIEKEIPGEIVDPNSSDDIDNENVTEPTEPKEQIEEVKKDSNSVKSQIWENAAIDIIENEIDIDQATEEFYDRIVDGLGESLDNNEISNEEYKRLLEELDDLKGKNILQEDLLSRIEDMEEAEPPEQDMEDQQETQSPDVSKVPTEGLGDMMNPQRSRLPKEL